MRQALCLAESGELINKFADGLFCGFIPHIQDNRLPKALKTHDYSHFRADTPAFAGSGSTADWAEASQSAVCALLNIQPAAPARVGG